MAARRLDAPALRRWAHSAVADLITHTDEINRLNVFPVADADTGTNMLFTMRAAWAQADGCEDDDLATLTAAMADGALRGARGNSGVILSQILRALADVSRVAAAQRGGRLTEVDAALVADALRHAVDLVAASMGEVVDGTIVSVLQAAACGAEAALSHHRGPAEVVGAAADAAADALERTPTQLDVLAEAGVVDAGGRGLLVLLDALTVTLAGHAPKRRTYEPAHVDAAPADGTPQFEVMYLLAGCDPTDVEELRACLDELGDSVAIATSAAGDGAPPRYSVHVHADDAGAAVELALRFGTPSNIQITSLHGGGHGAGAWTRERAVLAVVDGEGAERLFGGEGAHVLPFDPEVPISAQQLLHALVNTGAAQVVVLPNGYVAAEELLAGWAVASDWGIMMVPVPTGSMVQGLAALAVHDPDRPLVDDGYTMARATGGARCGSVRVSTEEALTWAGPCRPGDGLGITGDEVVIVGADIVAAASGLIDLLLAAGGELVTVLLGVGVGADVGDALAEHMHARHPGTELTVFHTGHRSDALLIGVE
ncbi:DAK2 domain-containing protein [Mycobacterium sp. pV006]|uniref:DAK2 domain-containing protein n=1 Tax=Mycobacterium sp. pV006 TaxID=3238983 RepID=UPI00351B0991